ncbi:ABC transporter substrate-binding protein [Aquitalea magnusonii]|nr:ABC transporter substrate-binding protein [Aquitalea magnusonii]
MKSFTNKKLIPCLITAGLIAGSSYSFADTIIKVGFSSPLSGPQAHYGKDNENGVKLAINEINSKGLTVAGQKVKLQLVSEDDQADPRVGTQVAQRLVDSGVKVVFGHFNSGVSIPASRIYSEAGIPQLSVSTNPTYTTQGYKTTYRLVGSDSQVGAALAQFAVKTLKAKSIAVVDDRTAYGQGIADEFVKAVSANGGKVAKREFTSDKATDFSSILTSIKSINPDVIFYGGADAQAGPMARQIKRLGLKAKIMGGDMLSTETFIQLAGADASQHYSAVPGGVLESRPAGKAFVNKYKTAFKDDVVLFAPQFYDAVMLYVDAAKHANSFESSKILQALSKTKYDGISSNFSFNAKGDLLKAPVTISQVINGKWVVQSVVQ